MSTLSGVCFLSLIAWYFFGPQPQPLVMLVLALWFRSLSRETYLEDRITKLEKR